jgi:ribosome-binding factor A
MRKKTSRPRRMAEQIQRELSEIIRAELKDPRIKMITLTDVTVSPDFSHCHVYFSLLGSDEEMAETAEGLTHAAGFLRSQLAQRLTSRTVPDLRFIHDASVERGARLSRLIDEAVHSQES